MSVTVVIWKLLSIIAEMDKSITKNQTNSDLQAFRHLVVVLSLDRWMWVEAISYVKRLAKNKQLAIGATSVGLADIFFAEL